LVEHGAPYTYEALLDTVPPELAAKTALLGYCAHVQARLAAWWAGAGKVTDFTQAGNVYYGDVSLHEVLERTGWHAGQHTRQLMLTLQKLGVALDRPLIDADFAGLPMPAEIWDNETDFD
ncbi:MAG: hypothetical protein O7A03_11995, partial [Alphaproteobacteria bacterium]|nr:hypothetical protein [Alphaproteobacteria bacterium]